jgi:hypothetical protein
MSRWGLELRRRELAVEEESRAKHRTLAAAPWPKSISACERLRTRRRLSSIGGTRCDQSLRRRPGSREGPAVLQTRGIVSSSGQSFIPPHQRGKRERESLGAARSWTRAESFAGIPDATHSKRCKRRGEHDLRSKVAEAQADWGSVGWMADDEKVDLASILPYPLYDDAAPPTE